MKRILSADMSGKIPKTAIKKLVKSSSDAMISNDAVEAMAEMLEKRAREIAEFAVARARKKERKVILKEDIEAYRIGR